MTFLLLFFLSTNNAYRHEFNSIPKNNTKSMLWPYKRKGNIFFVQKKRKNENHELRFFFECTEKCNNNAFLTSTKKKWRERKKVDKQNQKRSRILQLLMLEMGISVMQLHAQNSTMPRNCDRFVFVCVRVYSGLACNNAIFSCSYFCLFNICFFLRFVIFCCRWSILFSYFIAYTAFVRRVW